MRASLLDASLLGRAGRRVSLVFVSRGFAQSSEAEGTAAARIVELQAKLAAVEEALRKATVAWDTEKQTLRAELAAAAKNLAQKSAAHDELASKLAAATVESKDLASARDALTVELAAAQQALTAEKAVVVTLQAELLERSRQARLCVGGQRSCVSRKK